MLGQDRALESPKARMGNAWSSATLRSCYSAKGVFIRCHLPTAANEAPNERRLEDENDEVLAGNVERAWTIQLRKRNRRAKENSDGRPLQIILDACEVETEVSLLFATRSGNDLIRWSDNKVNADVKERGEHHNQHPTLQQSFASTRWLFCNISGLLSSSVFIP